MRMISISKNRSISQRLCEIVAEGLELAAIFMMFACWAIAVAVIVAIFLIPALLVRK